MILPYPVRGDESAEETRRQIEVEDFTDLFQLDLFYPHFEFIIRFRIPDFHNSSSRQRGCQARRMSAIYSVTPRTEV